MRPFWKMLGVLITLSAPSLACGYGPTHIEWNGWQLSSSEDLWAGRKYHSYPLYNLVDSNPQTAWVWSGNGKCYEYTEKKYPSDIEAKHWLSLSSYKPIAADALWIRTGFDKSNALWKRNNRVAKLRLKCTNGRDEEFPPKTVVLSDKRGWHQISLPTTGKVASLKIELLDFYCGRDDDVALSEVALYHHGHKLDWRLPAAVVVDDGLGEACRAEPTLAKAKPQPPHFVSLFTHQSVFTPSALDERGIDWSESGRYASGHSFYARGQQQKVWVFDTKSKRLLWQKAASFVRGAYFQSACWNGNRLEFCYQRANTKYSPELLVRRTVFRG